MGELTDVKSFMEKFHIDTPHPVKPGLIAPAAICRRMNHLEEEYNELAEAVVTQDLPGIADALVDMVYVLKGTAVAMGLPWDELWADVQRANMAKAYDPTSAKIAVKPAGWVGPQTEEILRNHGWEGARGDHE